MKYDNKTLIGAAILALVLVVAFIFALKHKKVEQPLDIGQSSTSNMEQPKTAFHHLGIPVSSNPSYTEAVYKYINSGNLLQFDNNCQSHPRSLSIANGSTVMLDNRSPDSEVIAIGGNKYPIAPYDFKIVTVSVPKIPTTFTIDCTFAQNVNTLTVE